MRAHPSPTPFHARTVELNRDNAWVARGHFVVPAHYGSAAEEALAARYSVVLADITPQMQLRIQGEGAERLLSAACALSLKELGAGSALPVVWRADGGGVRGIGILARRARDHFVLTSADTDIAWFERASALYGAELHDETQATLQLTGPYAAETLRAAGLEAAIDINELRHEVFEWQGVLVTISRGAKRKLIGSNVQRKTPCTSLIAYAMQGEISRCAWPAKRRSICFRLKTANFFPAPILCPQEVMTRQSHRLPCSVSEAGRRSI